MSVPPSPFSALPLPLPRRTRGNQVSRAHVAQEGGTWSPWPALRPLAALASPVPPEGFGSGLRLPVFEADDGCRDAS